MDKKEFSRHLEQRTPKFAVSQMTLSAKLKGTPKGKEIRHQSFFGMICKC
jgi:hypothetical protein